MPRISGMRGFVWIKPKYPFYDVKIDSVSYKNKIFRFDFTMGSTETTGNFSIDIYNLNKEYTDKWTGGEIVDLYLDRTDGTTKRFTGKITDVRYNYTQNDFYSINIIGDIQHSELLDVVVTEEYSSQENSVILDDLFTNYTAGYDSSTNVDTSTVTSNFTWNQKPFWDCVREICDSAGFDCFIDVDKNVYFFENESRECTTEAIVHRQNIIRSSGLGQDINKIKNKVYVYGKETNNIPILASAENSTSQTTYGLRELVIIDNNITSDTIAQERADAELTIGINPPREGKIEAVCLVNLNPGETIRISDPVNNLDGSFYKVTTLTHKLSDYGLTTEVKVEKETPGISHLFKKRYTKEQETTNIRNKNKHESSFYIPFNAETYIDTTSSDANYTVEDGKIRMSSGTTCTIITTSKTMSITPTQTEVKMFGSNTGGIQSFISVDNGSSWEDSAQNILHTVTGSGLQLKGKFIMTSENSEIDTFAILYK